MTLFYQNMAKKQNYVIWTRIADDVEKRFDTSDHCLQKNMNYWSYYWSYER